MSRQVVKLLLLFSLSCLWVAEPGELFAFSYDGSAVTFSRFDVVKKEVDLSDSDAEQMFSSRFSFDFEPDSFYIRTDYSCAKPLSHVTHDVQSRGPPTSWL